MQNVTVFGPSTIEIMIFEFRSLDPEGRYGYMGYFPTTGFVSFTLYWVKQEDCTVGSSCTITEEA